MTESNIQKPYPLSRDTVHIWRVALDQSEKATALLEKLLCPEERQRSERFHFKKDRLRYTAARGALRTILARYLNEPPENLLFDQGPHGKPFLTGPSASRNLQFNLSHCEDAALIAVALERHLGVDVEKAREMFQLEHILERFFSREERNFIASVRSEEQNLTFLTLWTRREAAAKALGLDLSAALGRLNIPLYAPGEKTKIKHPKNIETDMGLKKRCWFLQDLQLDPTHAGAVCVEGEYCTLSFRSLEDTF